MPPQRADHQTLYRDSDGDSHAIDAMQLRDSSMLSDDGSVEVDVGAVPVDRTSIEIWENDRSLDQDARRNSDTEKSSDGEFSDDSVRMYLRDIGRVTLLTAGEEATLARAIELAFWLERVEKDIRGENTGEDEPVLRDVPADVLATEVLHRMGAGA